LHDYTGILLCCISNVILYDVVNCTWGTVPWSVGNHWASSLCYRVPNLVMSLMCFSYCQHYNCC